MRPLNRQTKNEQNFSLSNLLSKEYPVEITNNFDDENDEDRVSIAVIDDNDFVEVNLSSEDEVENRSAPLPNKNGFK